MWYIYITPLYTRWVVQKLGEDYQSCPWLLLFMACADNNLQINSFYHFLL